MPSIDPMLITLAGSSGRDARSNIGTRSRVKKNIALTFVSITLSKPASGYSASAAPQAAPALLTSMCNASSLDDNSLASRSHSSADERSAGIETQDPIADSSAATRSQTSFLRDEM